MSEPISNDYVPHLRSQRVELPTRLLLAFVGLASAATCFTYELLYPVHAEHSERHGIVSIASLVLWLCIMAALLLPALPPAPLLRHSGRRRAPSSSTPTHPHTHDRPRSVRLFGHSVSRAARSVPDQAWPALGALAVIATYHGIIGVEPLTYGDWGYFSRQTLSSQFLPIPPLWTPQGLGTDNILGAPQYVLLQLTGALARAGLPYSLIERLLYFFPAICLLYYLTFRLLRRARLGPAASTLGALVAVLNTYEISIIAGGWLTIAVATAILPALLLAAEGIGRKPPVNMALLMGAELGVAAWLSLPVTLLDLACVVLFVLMANLPNLRTWSRHDWLVYVVITLTAFTTLQAIWLLPGLTGAGLNLPRGYRTVNALTQFSFQSLVDGLASFQPAWPTLQPFSMHHLEPLGLSLPILALTASLTIRAGERHFRAVAVLYLASSALATGALPPFSFINQWVFSNVPAASLYRNPVVYLSVTEVMLAALVAKGASTLSWDCDLEAARTISLPHGATYKSSQWHHYAGRCVLSLFSAVAVASLAIGSLPALLGHIRQNLYGRGAPAGVIAATDALERLPPGNTLWVPYVPAWTDQFDARHPVIGLLTLENLYDEVTGITLSGYAPTPYWLGTPDIADPVLDQMGICYVMLDLHRSPYIADTLDYVRTVEAVHRGLSGFRSVRFGNKVTLYERSCPGVAATAVGTALAVTNVSRALPPFAQHSADHHYRAFLWSPSLYSLGTTRPTISERLRPAFTVRANLRTPAILDLTHYEQGPTANAIGTLILTASRPVYVWVSLFNARSVQPVVIQTLNNSGNAATHFDAHLNLLMPCVPRSYHAVYRTAFLEVAVQPEEVGPITVSLSPLTGAHRPPSPANLACSYTGRGRSSGTSGLPPRGTLRASCSATLVSATPTRYVLRVRSSRACPHDRQLVLMQTFNANWTAHASGRTLHHYKAAGWANGFTLPAHHGPFTVTITYGLQRLLDVGASTSDAAAVVIGLLLSLLALGSRRHGRLGLSQRFWARGERRHGSGGQ